MATGIWSPGFNFWSRVQSPALVSVFCHIMSWGLCPGMVSSFLVWGLESGFSIWCLAFGVCGPRFGFVSWVQSLALASAIWHPGSGVWFWHLLSSTWCKGSGFRSWDQCLALAFGVWHLASKVHGLALGLGSKVQV